MDNKTFDNYFSNNKALWNKKTPIHLKSDFYNVEKFKKGESSLNGVEIERLGYIEGKSILHLQCHFGLDTLSLARMGAKVTGVDISDQAIKEAQSLNNELGLDAEFICCNVYDLKSHLNKKYDIIFTSYGAIPWLPDLNLWGDILSHFLNDKGYLFMVEFHPLVWIFDDDFNKITYSYFNEGVIEMDTENTYADKNTTINHKEYSWNHSLSEVFSALKNNNFQVSSFEEYPFSSYDVFPDMEKGKDGYYRMKKFNNMIPLMYSLKAVKLP